VLHSWGCRRSADTEITKFVTIPFFIHVNLPACRQGDGEGVDFCHVISSDDLASRVKLDNTTDRIPVNWHIRENILGPFQVLWIPLWNLTWTNPTELSYRWIQNHHRCTDWGGVCHQYFPANLVDPASYWCPSSQVCENRNCAAVSIPYRTKFSWMGPTIEWVVQFPNFVRIFAKLLHQSFRGVYMQRILELGLKVCCDENERFELKAMPASKSELQFNHRSSRDGGICIDSVVVSSFNCLVPAETHSAFSSFHYLAFRSANFCSLSKLFCHDQKNIRPWRALAYARKRNDCKHVKILQVFNFFHDCLLPQIALFRVLSVVWFLACI